MNFSRQGIKPLLVARILPVVALCCCLVLSGPAFACRQRAVKEEHFKKFDLIVLVSVKSSEWADNPGWNTWKITAQSIRTILGSAQSSLYTFEATLSSSGCEPDPLPPAGERWVLYFDKADPTKVKDALPLNLVRSHDRRLKSIR